MRFTLAFFIGLFLLVTQSRGQDTLPKFSVVRKPNGKILISWRNNYPEVNQISIQRSPDSVKHFTTLLTVPDPSIPENGFVDSKPPGEIVYYRLFILLDDSHYTFSKPQRAMSEAELANQKASPKEEELMVLPKIDNQRIYYMQDNPSYPKPAITVPSTIGGHTAAVVIDRPIYIYVKEKDSVIAKLSPRQLRQFRDSLLGKTKDTLLFVNSDTLLIKPFVLKEVEVREVYRISSFVFTAKDGNVTISLPDASRKKYMVKFFEQDNSPLLEVKDIKDSHLILDKANFVHSGWFRFELYEEGRLKEKNRLFVPKEF
jgi:hypothetical protein